MIKAKTPRSTQTNEKFTAADNMSENAIKTPNNHLNLSDIEKNSIIKRDIMVENPAKSPKAFQDPKIVSVFPPKTPKDRKSGTNKRKL